MIMWVFSQDASELDFESGNKGFVYVGHIPRGFYEKQMKGYFSQFGKINKLRLSRSKRVR